LGTFHMIFGTILIILMIVATIVEITRPAGVPKGLRGATIGLLDLEVILGIITWIVVKPSSSFAAHPVFMVAGVVVVHIFTGRKKSRKTRILGWLIADVLLILGAALFHA